MNVWQMFMGTVPHCMQPSPSDGSLNLNVAEHWWKMTPCSTASWSDHGFAMLLKYCWWQIDKWGPADSQGGWYFVRLRPEYFTWLCRFRQSLRRWTPRFLTPVYKSSRVEMCSELLAIYSANSDNILSHTVTGDEPRIHHWNLNSSRCSGSTSTQCHPGSFALSRRMEKSWPQFSWIAKVCCWWITFHI